MAPLHCQFFLACTTMATVAVHKRVATMAPWHQWLPPAHVMMTTTVAVLHHWSFFAHVMTAAAPAWTAAPWHFWSSLAHTNKRESC